MPEHWIHNLSPFAIHFWGEVGIRWYGLAYLVGIAWGYWMFVRWHRAGRSPLTPLQAQDFALYAGLGMIIGGRLGYCLIYGRTHWAADPLYLFKLWEGGMASHGGIAGMAVGSWLYARKRAVSLLVLCDMISAVAPMGVLCGRLANFVNGELWGHPSQVPWAVIFPTAGDGVPRHPSQLYEAFLEGLCLLALIVPIHAVHRRPGLTTGVLLSGYAVARFIGEIFREADLGHPPYWGWMNKGQALSIPVLLIGLAILVWALRRPSRPAAYVGQAPDASGSSGEQERKNAGV
jgi:phosphatidylglycerol---prolipoprotein diacylglyceryl transferase